MTRRLIEEWLPIADLGEESVRERRAMSALPPTYYLHVWWARRPLVASRAAVLASLLPSDADRKKFMHILGIHGDPVEAKRTMDTARRKNERVANPYGYDRAFKYNPSLKDIKTLRSEFERNGLLAPVVLDPTAGGGSIPFEATRMGIDSIGNDLNPVAALILRATVEWPVACGSSALKHYERISKKWRVLLQKAISDVFPPSRSDGEIDTTMLWARTIKCPSCDGLIPLSPNWRLAAGGTGVRIRPNTSTRACEFEIVSRAAQQSEGTVTGGDAQCPFPDCGRVVDGDEIKSQAQGGGMGEQLFAVVYKKLTYITTKTGKKREKWVRKYRTPRAEDDTSEYTQQRLDEKLPEWEALDMVPTEPFPTDGNDLRPIYYGMPLWRDLFSPRQLLCHGTSVEVYRAMLVEEQAKGELDEATKAAFVYLAFALDKFLNWNARLASWNVKAARLRSVFDRHDFAFKWSFGEMAPLVEGLGYDWVLRQTGKCVKELIELTCPSGSLSFDSAVNSAMSATSCKSGDALDHLDDASIDAVVMDPPYYDNVMYAELSDFFYVWLKRTAGYVVPDLFRRNLTDKEDEAVANPARFKGQKKVKDLAHRDYRDKMAAIFAESRRVLKPDGILTLMFTHKATGAWDALASGLLEAGFTITASWPVNTEFESSLHIKEKAAAKSTMFLVCRLREARPADEPAYWEDVEPKIAAAVKRRIGEFQEAGISGVDLYLSCFGPALEELAQHWPLRRGMPREVGEGGLFDKADPYAVTPEDALDAARNEVKQWRLQRLLHMDRQTDLDNLTEWFVLAWDAFRAPEFPYDEGLRLARVVGIDLDGAVIGRIAAKKGGSIVLWDSANRAKHGSLGTADGSRSMLDALHHAAHRARTRGVQAARELVEDAGLSNNPSFQVALSAVLEVLPVSSTFTRIPDEKESPLTASAGDFDALEHLRRLAFSDKVKQPRQLELWAETDA